MNIKYKYINQINIYEQVKYEMIQGNILKVSELILETSKQNVYYYNLNNLVSDKTYMSHGYITNIEFDNDTLVLTLLNPIVDSNEFKDEGIYHDFNVVEENVDEQGVDIITFEEIIFPEREKSKEEILQEEIEVLKQKIIQDNKKNEKAQFEMLQLIMDMM